ncbi:MAG: hypothetical protein KAV82_09900 [Phycisphaerae bacterium]|nr:hypothetical protein [Phycisphaerae bacterium]
MAAAVVEKAPAPKGRQTEAESYDTRNARASLSIVMGVLDAVQSELLMSGLCKGGEEIELWLRPQIDQPRVIELIYRVPDVLHVYREAYVQDDRTVILASELAFRDSETRYSMHKVQAGELTNMDSYSTRIVAKLAASLTEGQKRSHELRELRKKRSLNQP